MILIIGYYQNTVEGVFRILDTMIVETAKYALNVLKGAKPVPPKHSVHHVSRDIA